MHVMLLPPPFKAPSFTFDDDDDVVDDDDDDDDVVDDDDDDDGDDDDDDDDDDADDDDVLTSCVWVQVTDQTLQAKLSIMMLWAT